MLDRRRARCRDVRQRKLRGVEMLDRGRARCRDVRQGKSDVSRC